MAANANKVSMAEAILASVSKYGYKEIVPFINERDAISLDNFKTTKLAEYFVIDSSRAYVNGRANPNHIYKLFGNYGGHDATQVRLLLLKHMAIDPSFHMRRGTVCLEMRNTLFERWLHRVADNQMYCDELGILSLSHMYRRHSLVVTVNKMWSTIEHSSPLNLLELLNECSVKLIYLGQLRFGELKPKPKAKPTRTLPSLLAPPSANLSTSTTATTNRGGSGKPKAQLPDSKSVDTSTCTPNNVANRIGATTAPVTEQTPSLPVATVTPNVGTAGKVLNVETNPDNMGNVEMDNSHVHVETQRDKQCTSHVESSADQPVMLHVRVETSYLVSPNTASVDITDTQSSNQQPPGEKQQAMLLGKTTKLVLKLLNELEIDVWCNKTPDYHRFEPPSDSSEAPTNSRHTLRARKRNIPLHGLSLRKTNTVNYAPMLDSDADDSNDAKKPTSNKI